MRHQRPNRVLLDLIHRTKEMVRELDNLEMRRMKKILIVANEDAGAAEEATSNGPSDSAEDSTEVS